MYVVPDEIREDCESYRENETTLHNKKTLFYRYTRRKLNKEAAIFLKIGLAMSIGFLMIYMLCDLISDEQAPAQANATRGSTNASYLIPQNSYILQPTKSSQGKPTLNRYYPNSAIHLGSFGRSINTFNNQNWQVRRQQNQMPVYTTAERQTYTLYQPPTMGNEAKSFIYTTR